MSMTLFHRWIFFLCVERISSVADPLKTLRASVGGNVTLPDAVEETGFLLYERKKVALVDERKVTIYGDKYKKRLHWNQNTGRFTLSRLQKNDSGMYKVGFQKKNGVYVDYELVIYDSVPTPKVRLLNRSSEICSLSCYVDSAPEDVTLQWSIDTNVLKKNQSAASLSLILFSQQDLNSPLQCVAENPAENKTVSLDVTTLCQLNSGVIISANNLILIMCGVFLVLCVLGAYCTWRIYKQ